MTINHRPAAFPAPCNLSPAGLPLAGDGADAAEQSLRKWALRRGGLLLVADDSPVERMVTIVTLERAGFQVVSAADGREALEIVRSADRRFDGVVMDVCMPGMDGISAARAIRALPCRNSALPIFALTSNAAAEDRAACLAAGMNEHTVKPLPLSLSKLLQAFKTHFTPV